MLGHDPDSLISRLWNWGRVSRIDPCRPKGATINHLYGQMIPDGDADGRGEITAQTIIVPQKYDPKPEPAPLDEYDAEIMGGWIKQLLQGHRGTLARRHVLSQPLADIETGCAVGKDKYYAAVYALERLMVANWETVRQMRKMGAG